MLPSTPDSRLGRCALAAGLCPLLILACASLNPGPEYARTREIIQQRTGSPQVYDPAADEDWRREQIQALLASGVTVDKAVTIALLNNRGLQAAFQDINAARADLVQAGLLTNPVLSMAFLIPEGGGQVDITFALAQELAEFWQIPARKRVAHAQLEQSILNVGQQALQLTADVQSSCYQILLLRATETIARDNLELAHHVLGWAKENQPKASKLPQLDVSLARGNLLDAQARLVALERDRRIAEEDLARMLGLSRWTEPWVLADSLPEPQPTPDLENLVAVALEQRLDARAAQFQVQAAASQVDLQYANIFPSLTAGPSMERMEQRALPSRTILADTARASVAAGQLAAPGIQSRAQRTSARDQLISTKAGPAFQATLPLWDPNRAQIAKARTRLIQAAINREDLLDSIAQDVRDALLAVRAAEQLGRSFAPEQVRLARLSMELMHQAYDAANEDMPTLLGQETFLFTQRQAYITVLHDWATARANLERAIGGRLPDVPILSPTTAPAAEWTRPTSRPATNPA
jgi:outer membrane protein, heavy metal efflux system